MKQKVGFRMASNSSEEARVSAEKAETQLLDVRAHLWLGKMR